MGIYDREYYRREGPSFLTALAEHGQACKWLIGINVAIYILQLVTQQAAHPELLNDTVVMVPGSDPVTDFLVLDPSAVLHGEFWRLLTAAFAHSPSSYMHILFNMLFLWWFGHEMEDLYGWKEFLGFYLLSAVLGNVAYLLWSLGEPIAHPAPGASGAVTAVMVLFALHYPMRTMYIWFFPLPIWIFVLFQVAQDTFGLLGSQGTGGVAVACHLGGAAFGFLYYKMHWRVLNWVPSRLLSSSPNRPRLRVYREESESARPAPVTATLPPPPPPPNPDLDEHLEAKLDAVLEKMARSGRESLTESERQILLRASEVYKRKRT
jgi:membrane associated rhomboid family serine protease